METLGRRLRAERLRLGLSQEEFAAVGGLGIKAQSRYELDERTPDVTYMTALTVIGVDIWYVMTGEAMPEKVISEEERELVAHYRRLSEAGKAMVQVVLSGCINDGSMTTTGTAPDPAHRVKRLSENRHAALDTHASEVVKRAVKQTRKASATRRIRGKSNVKPRE